MHIEKDMTIYTAAELKPAIVAAVADAATPVLDLAAVAEIDSAGLQLLLLATREAASRGCTLRITNAGAAVAEVLDLVGLRSLRADVATEN